MTQKIFKRSNKEDMKLLFSILPNEIKYIGLGTLSDGSTKIIFGIPDGKNLFFPVGFIQIDFETSNLKEMIIVRGDYEL